jgi:hypothetical protein
VRRSTRPGAKGRVERRPPCPPDSPRRSMVVNADLNQTKKGTRRLLRTFHPSSRLAIARLSRHLTRHACFSNPGAPLTFPNSSACIFLIRPLNGMVLLSWVQCCPEVRRTQGAVPNSGYLRSGCGIRTLTAVPFPGAPLMVSSPPSSRARSRIPRIPRDRPSERCSSPIPWPLS